MANFLTLCALALVNAQAPVDRYQKVGNEVGAIYSSIGEVLSANTADSRQLASAAQQADYAIASLKQEIRTMDWSYLGPQAAKQQAENLEKYVGGLDDTNSQLHAIATKAATVEYSNQANAVRDNQAYYQQQYAVQGQTPTRPVLQAATAMPKMQNKAVLKEESHVTTTSSSVPTTSTEDSKSASKESKSESKSAERQEKSESRAAASESKSESKSAAAAAKSTSSSNHTNSTTSSRPKSTDSSESKKSKNAAGIIGISGSAIVAAIFALV